MRMLVIIALGDLTMRPAASMAGYSREKFGPPWNDTDGNGCDTRNDILRLDLRHERFKADPTCVIATGTLSDAYTGTKIKFVRGVGTSSAAQIDHVVALVAAWRTGARTWTAAHRLQIRERPTRPARRLDEQLGGDIGDRRSETVARREATARVAHAGLAESVAALGWEPQSASVAAIASCSAGVTQSRYSVVSLGLVLRPVYAGTATPSRREMCDPSYS
jgi:hypothetical protein